MPPPAHTGAATHRKKFRYPAPKGDPEKTDRIKDTVRRRKLEMNMLQQVLLEEQNDEHAADGGAETETHEEILNKLQASLEEKMEQKHKLFMLLKEVLVVDEKKKEEEDRKKKAEEAAKQRLEQQRLAQVQQARNITMGRGFVPGIPHHNRPMLLNQTQVQGQWGGRVPLNPPPVTPHSAPRIQSSFSTPSTSSFAQTTATPVRSAAAAGSFTSPTAPMRAAVTPVRPSPSGGYNTMSRRPPDEHAAKRGRFDNKPQSSFATPVSSFATGRGRGYGRGYHI